MTDVSIRTMREADLPSADRVFRLAFGTYLGVNPPEAFGGDAESVRARWRAEPELALVAESGGEIAGLVMVANRGSFGYLGPLTVHPSFWNAGIGKKLLGPALDLLDSHGVGLTGLYTFPSSPRHLGLYQGFAFWPRFLTMNMSRLTGKVEKPAGAQSFSEIAPGERAAAIAAARELTDSILEGLDITVEIVAVDSQKLGDTVLLWDAGSSRLAGIGVCHIGAGSEAGSGSCYLKFACARPGPGAENRFEALLNACDALGAGRGASRLTGGVNAARSRAYRLMLGLGFRTDWTGVAMHRPDVPGHCRADAFAIDDWR